MDLFYGHNETLQTFSNIKLPLLPPSPQVQLSESRYMAVHHAAQEAGTAHVHHKCIDRKLFRML